MKEDTHMADAPTYPETGDNPGSPPGTLRWVKVRAAYDLRTLGSTLVHSVGGTVVLLVNMWLNVYKPRGLTPYGWRKQQEQHINARL